MMAVRVLPTAQEVAVAAADLFDELLRRQPDAVLGLATGSTPLGMYDELIRRHDQEGLSFAEARAFLLDEYVGLPREHPGRYRNVILRQLTDRVGLPAHRVHAPPVESPDLAAACVTYEGKIADAGGVDLQVLGLGTDGHIAFNMPGSEFTSRTRLTTLTEQTVLDNARFFGGDATLVPREAVTQGLATIMQARSIVLIVTGAGKAAALHSLVEGPLSEQMPASVLRDHPRTTVLVDQVAVQLLSLR